MFRNTNHSWDEGGATLPSTRSRLGLWLFWSGLISLTFSVNSFVGWFLVPDPFPQWAITLDAAIRAVPWALRSLLSPAPNETDGLQAARVAAAGFLWFLLPRALSAAWPEFAFIPIIGPGEGQWWWLAGGVSLAISTRSIVSGAIGALTLFGYLYVAPSFNLVEALHIPRNLTAHLLWDNLVLGTQVGTAMFLSEVVSDLVRGRLHRLSKATGQA